MSQRALLRRSSLSQARDVQRSAPGDIGRIIVDLDFASDKAVTEMRAETLGAALRGPEQVQNRPDCRELRS